MKPSTLYIGTKAGGSLFTYNKYEPETAIYGSRRCKIVSCEVIPDCHHSLSVISLAT